MAFSDGLASFVNGFMRSQEASANRARLDAQDKRTEQMFALQLDAANAAKRERELQEQARDEEYKHRQRIAEGPAGPPVSAMNAPAAPAQPGTTANDGNAGEKEAAIVQAGGAVPETPKATPAVIPAPGAAADGGISGVMDKAFKTPSQLFNGGVSKFQQEMALADALTNSENPYARANADTIRARARRARSEGIEDMMTALESGDANGALEAFQSAGAMRLPQGATMRENGTIKDAYTGAERKRYSLLDQDGKPILEDVQHSVYSYLLTPKERLSLAASRVNADGKLEAAKEKVDQAWRIAQLRMSGAGGGRSGGSDATVRDMSTASEQIFKHMQGVYGADKDATPQERAAANTLAVSKAAEASSIWNMNAQAGNVIPPVMAANALTLAQDKSKIMVQKTNKGDSVYVVNVGGMPVILGPAKQVAAQPGAQPQAAPIPQANAPTGAGLNARPPTFQEQEFRAAIGKQGWTPAASMKGLFGSTPLYGKRDADGNMTYKTQEELSSLLGIDY